jgi:dolichyl-phosphate-mannose--protein O-mannosyl transferase
MMCFYIWSLYLAVKSRWKFAAMLYGLSLASKWSALYGIVPLAFIYLSQNPLKSWNLKRSLYHLLFAVRCILIALTVYILTFAPFVISGHTWDQWWELHRQMWYYHTHLVATHGYQSTPLQWIFDARPVWYYVKYLEQAVQNIYVIGNPVILWLGLVALVLQVKKILKFPHSILYALYFVLFLPWVFSPRIMFYYHYLPSSTFLCVILANYLASLNKKLIFYILVLCFLSLLFISPMLYGFAMPTRIWDTYFSLLPSWK